MVYEDKNKNRKAEMIASKWTTLGEARGMQQKAAQSTSKWEDELCKNKD